MRVRCFYWLVWLVRLPNASVADVGRFAQWYLNEERYGCGAENRVSTESVRSKQSGCGGEMGLRYFLEAQNRTWAIFIHLTNQIRHTVALILPSSRRSSRSFPRLALGGLSQVAPAGQSSTRIALFHAILPQSIYASMTYAHPNIYCPS